MTIIKNAVQDTHAIVFNLYINSMSADRQLDLSKVGIEVNTLPKESKALLEDKIFPTPFLRKYSLIREQAFAELAKGAATAIDLGTVTSRSGAVEKIDALNALKAKWVETLDKDAETYDDMCSKYILERSQKAVAEGADPQQVHLLSELLIKRQPKWEEVRAKMSFNYSVTPVALEEDDFDSELFEAQRDGVVAIREGVMGSLVQFVCKEAHKLLELAEDRNSGRSEYSLNYRTVERITGLTKKLHGLAFVHKDIKPVADGIDSTLSFMPKVAGAKDVKLTSACYNDLCACLEALSDQILVVECLARGLPLVTTSKAKAVVTAIAQSSTAVVQPTAQAASTASAAVQQVATTTAQSASAPQAAAVQPNLTLSPVQDEETETEATAEEEVTVDAQVVVASAPQTRNRRKFV
jgi:hypothetical protein